LIISRTPFRISFFGGGTDFPLFYNEHGGTVLSTTIDKYCYISCKELPPFFNYQHRLVYSKTEEVNSIDEIEHPSIREVFNYYNIKKGLEILHFSDLPARAGLGASSAFTVGLINCLNVIMEKKITKMDLALSAIEVEQNWIKENVGSQDQVATSFGGLNKITFTANNAINVVPVHIDEDRADELQKHLMLFFTGTYRNSSDISKHHILDTQKNIDSLLIMKQLAEESIKVLTDSNVSVTQFGKLMHQSWDLKKRLTNKVTNEKIEDIYTAAISAGAISGKILGAGGGGFMIIFAKPGDHENIRKTLSGLLEVRFEFESEGSKILNTFGE
jgi:D-glycero-alpha-D-manno-heptose-7-phosphate kinase